MKGFLLFSSPIFSIPILLSHKPFLFKGEKERRMLEKIGIQENNENEILSWA
jgi:hypothetical protein